MDTDDVLQDVSGSKPPALDNAHVRSGGGSLNDRRAHAVLTRRTIRLSPLVQDLHDRVDNLIRVLGPRVKALIQLSKAHPRHGNAW